MNGQPPPVSKVKSSLTIKLIIGGAGLILLIVILTIILQSFSVKNAFQHQVLCQSQIQSLANACLQYANEHQGTLPKSFDDIAPLAGGATNLQRLLHCPSGSDKLAPSYQLVAAGKGLSELSKDTPMIVEISTNHRGQGANVAYGDGSIAWIINPTKLLKK